jgi:hypothetical protein
MRKWMTLAAISSLCSALILIMVIKVHRLPITPPRLDLDSAFMPGNPVPPHSYCDWRLAVTDTRFCVAPPLAGERISFDVDRYKGTIVRTSLSGRRLTVGELMLAWGQPSGYLKRGISFQVFWQDRSAYLVTSSLSPHSRVLFLSYDLQRGSQFPWRGLINRR